MKDSQRKAMWAKLRKGEYRRLQGTTGYETNPIIVSGTLANMNKYRRLGYTTLWSGEGKMAFVRPQPSCRKLKSLNKDEKMTTFNLKNLTTDRFGNYIYRLPSGFVRRYGRNKAEATRQIKIALENRKCASVNHIHGKE